MQPASQVCEVFSISRAKNGTTKESCSVIIPDRYRHILVFFRTFWGEVSDFKLEISVSMSCECMRVNYEVRLVIKENQNLFSKLSFSGLLLTFY